MTLLSVLPPNCSPHTEYQRGDSDRPCLFQENPHEKIFESACQTHANALFQRAEQISKTSFYPLWKRVCYLHIPRALTAIFTHPITKVLITISGLALLALLGIALYTLTAPLITNYILPFILNHTPACILDLFHELGKILTLISPWILPAIAVYWGLRELILLLPEISCLTPAIRTVSVFAILKFVFFSPTTIYGFMSDAAYHSWSFFWEGSQNIGLFFYEIQERAKVEQFQASKQATYQLWVKELKTSP